MELLSRDEERVRAKLAAAPESERARLTRSCDSQMQKLVRGHTRKYKASDTLVPSIIAGIVHGIIVMMSFGSFAIIIFGQSEHAELRGALAIGVSQQVMSASVLIGLFTIKGFFPFTMGGPTPPAALLCADVVKAVVDNVGDSEKKVPTALLTIALISILMGTMLTLISLTKTTIYALQLPYPVLCGFLGSVGVLLMRNAIAILLNTKLKWICIPVDMEKAKQLAPVGTVAQLVLGFAVALIFLQAVPRIRPKVNKKSTKAGLAVLPILFIFPLVVFYAAVVAGGFDLGADSELRTDFPPWLSPAPDWTWAPKDFFMTMYDFTKWDIAAIILPESIFRMLTAAFLCVIAGLVNMAGIEANAPQATALDMDKEFMALGCANLVVGVLGGHPGHHVAAFSLPMKKDGGTTRVAPWTASATWFLAFISAAPLSTIIPRFFFGGCFLNVGFGLARTFLYDNRKAMDRASKIIALLTVASAVMTDLNIASGIAFVLVALNFLRLSMNVNVVRAVQRADNVRAPCYRRAKAIEELKLHGHRIMVLYLEGYLFWGTVDEITSAFTDLIDGTEDDPEVIFVDLRYVNGIELSVINTFKKLHRLAESVGIKIKLCSLPSEDTVGPGLSNLIKSLPFANSKDLTELIEEAEDKLLQTWTSFSPPKAFVEDLYQKKSTIENSSVIHILRSYGEEYWKNRVFKLWKELAAQLHEELKQRRTRQKQSQLDDLVERTSAAYGIWWEHFDDKLVMGQTSYAMWRAAELVVGVCKRQSSVRTYVTESQKFPIRPFLTAETRVPMPDFPASRSGDALVHSRLDVAINDFQGPKADNIKGSKEAGNVMRSNGGRPLSPPVLTPPPTPGPPPPPFSQQPPPSLFHPPPSSLPPPSSVLDAQNDRDRHESIDKMEDDGSMDTVDTLDGTVFMDTRSVPVLGQAFLAQKAIICHDVLQLPENVFRRKTLAAEFEIKRVIFIPTPNGVIELGASVAPDKPKNICSAPVVLRESPAMLTSFENARILSNIFSATDPSQIARRVTENEFIELRKSLSWNLLLSMGTLGRSMTLTRESPILEEPDASVVISEDHPRAQDIYIILVGTFGTYKVSEAGNLVLIMKSPAGSMIGAEDVWAERPRSVQLQCLSDEGLVLALSREAVKRLELCTSPFVGPPESEEFIDFMKREMSLNMVITSSTFSNPEA